MISRRALLQGSLLPLAGAGGFAPSARASGAPLFIGQSSALTGPQAGFGLAMRDGLQAAIQAANAGGGVAGRPISLVSLDDAGDKTRTDANIQSLLGTHRAVCLAGFTTRPCAELAAQVSAAQGVALIGAFSGTPLLYSDKAATTFATRASYAQEMQAIVRHYRALGAKQFGFVHLEDARTTNVPLLRAIAEKEGGTLSVTAAVDRNGSGMNAAALATLEKSRPEVLILLANNKPLTHLLGAYAPKTLGLPKVVISFVDRELLLKDLGPAAAGIAFSCVVPEPYKERYSAVRAFKQAMQQSGRGASQVALEGYVTGMAVVDGLKRARNDSRAALIDSMYSAHEIDLGYARLQFSQTNRSGSNFVDLALSNGVAIVA
jgi:branched-chain amino acid transport system substrate-binding protein